MPEREPEENVRKSKFRSGKDESPARTLKFRSGIGESPNKK
jgi:hypothetical protein